jgi:UPF0716 protein FxsA
VRRVIPAFILLFIALPLIEIYLLIEVGSEFGALTAIGLLILAAVLGILLLRWQGFTLARRLRETIARGEPPAMEALKSVTILLSGVLLLLPGFFSDAVALLLLIPGVRQGLALWLLYRYGLARQRRPRGDAPGQGPQTIDGEFRREKPGAAGRDKRLE